MFAPHTIIDKTVKNNDENDDKKHIEHSDSDRDRERERE